MAEHSRRYGIASDAVTFVQKQLVLIVIQFFLQFLRLVLNACKPDFQIVLL